MKLPLRVDKLVAVLVHEAMHACVSCGRLKPGVPEEGLCELVSAFVMGKLIGNWRVALNHCSRVPEYQIARMVVTSQFEQAAGIPFAQATNKALTHFVLSVMSFAPVQ